MDNTLEQSLARLACGCRILELEGHGDMTLGHLSLRDPQQRGFWMKRNRVGLGEITGPEDFVLVNFDGDKRAGGAVSPSGSAIPNAGLLRPQACRRRNSTARSPPDP